MHGASFPCPIPLPGWVGSFISISLSHFSRFFIGCLIWNFWGKQLPGVPGLFLPISFPSSCDCFYNIHWLWMKEFLLSLFLLLFFLPFANALDFCLPYTRILLRVQNNTKVKVEVKVEWFYYIYPLTHSYLRNSYVASIHT